MPQPETDLARMLSSLEVTQRPGEFVYVSVEDPASINSLCVEATIREGDGLTIVVDRNTAEARGLPYTFVGAWLTLSVYSALESVGLTAAVSRALADAGIPANMLAGFHHDHILVPIGLVDDALAALKRLD